jgi:hypothetical protein
MGGAVRLRPTARFALGKTAQESQARREGVTGHLTVIGPVRRENNPHGRGQGQRQSGRA